MMKGSRKVSSFSEQFDSNLAKYIDVVLKIGLNLQRGQDLIIRTPISTAYVTRKVVARAYQLGAKLVNVLWADEEVSRARAEHSAEEHLTQYPKWITDFMEQAVDSGAAMLSIGPADPNMYAGIDPKRVQTLTRTNASYYQGVMKRLTSEEFNWLIVNVPVPAWNRLVYPNLPDQEAYEKLWGDIFRVCRVSEPDPVAAWQDHIALLHKRADYMNAKRYAELRYRAPGTDLRIGLPDGHKWISGSTVSKTGIEFVANMPTEEIFTLPHADRIDGVVTSTKPLPIYGTTIENIVIQFSEGQVVSAKASKGEEMLNNIINTDKGASSLGEVALVPHSSPISSSGLLFYDILFDENASNHLALGKAYNYTLEGGLEMTPEHFQEAGGNNSMIHVDFMIGSDQMDVDGVTADGKIEPVMRRGEWAFTI
jgi:aminopeptidase